MCTTGVFLPNRSSDARNCKIHPGFPVTTTSVSSGAISSAFLSPSAFAAFDPSSPLGPYELERREPGPRDVQIEIAYCGVCHSDLHAVRNEWAGTVYPCIPGHEIVGRVAAVGREVTDDRVQPRRGAAVAGIAEAAARATQ